MFVTKVMTGTFSVHRLQIIQGICWDLPLEQLSDSEGIRNKIQKLEKYSRSFIKEQLGDIRI